MRIPGIRQACRFLGIRKNPHDLKKNSLLTFKDRVIYKTKTNRELSAQREKERKTAKLQRFRLQKSIERPFYPQHNELPTFPLQIYEITFVQVYIADYSHGLTGEPTPCGFLESSHFQPRLRKFEDSGGSIPDCNKAVANFPRNHQKWDL